ncbi:hypothetical protein BC939DRAFT_86401 [Gamsiella multidivaricata]|uniref:uncharacterized protein n=1 Tax=Gamsiella multidivaricata TaxID=101098 RepID=UPI00221EB9B0|nr:uncharacterized protein BC939DRAFT_86401 [Gamsiella multidivaricata]KAI7827661.1 hypothetical protein BC939DRAFT_86401 [Gamsiella multidivaricata]
MTALRAMLQLRPGTSSLSSSPSHTSPAFSAKDSRPLSTSASPTFSYLHSHQPTISSNTLTTSPATALTPTTKTRPTTATTTTTSTSHSSSKKPYNLGLHSGAASGNLGLVKFALDNGQPIDSAVNGVLPIHAACCSNANVAVVLFLIERGADVNARRYPRKYSGERVGA